VAQLNIKLRSAGLPEAKPLVDQGSTETKDAEGGH
jgi:hypothetical protein